MKRATHRGCDKMIGICSLPTPLLFKSGRVVQQVIGAVPRARLEAVVSQLL